MSKSIPLTQGKFAIVSDQDFDEISKHRWSLHPTPRGTFYAQRAAPGNSTIYMHRQILNPAPKLDVDHINGDGLDNRRENLRAATRSMNLANSRGRKAASGYRGVYAHRATGKAKWRVGISKDGKRIQVGLFRDPEEAARKYDELATELFGEFATLNFPVGEQR